MSLIKDVLWDNSPDEPLNELGDLHWLFLNLSWFSTLEQCKVKPLINSGCTVVLDNWYYKLFARFSLKVGFDQELLKKCFDSLLKPDITVFLDIDPHVAVRRRNSFSITESGNMDGLKGKTVSNFITYQYLVRDVLNEFSKKEGWIKLRVNNMTEEEVTNNVLYRLASKGSC